MVCDKCSADCIPKVKSTKGATTADFADKAGKYYVTNSGTHFDVRTVDGDVQLCYNCYSKHQNQENVILNELKEKGKVKFKASDYRLRLDDF